MIRDARLEIRLSKDLLEMVRKKAKARDGTITEYIEELVMVNLGLDDIKLTGLEEVPAPGSSVLVAESFTGATATGEHQERLNKAKEALANIGKPKLPYVNIDTMEGVQVEDHFVRDEDVPEDDYSQARVVGRHKK